MLINECASSSTNVIITPEHYLRTGKKEKKKWGMEKKGHKKKGNFKKKK